MVKFQDKLALEGEEDEFIKNLCSGKLKGCSAVRIMKRMVEIVKPMVGEDGTERSCDAVAADIGTIFDVPNGSSGARELRRYVSLAMGLINSRAAGRDAAAQKQEPEPADSRTAPGEEGSYEGDVQFLTRLKERRMHNKADEIAAELRRVCEKLLDGTFFPAANALQEKINARYGVRTRYVTLIKYIPGDLEKWQREWLEGNANGHTDLNACGENGLPLRDIRFIAELKRGRIKGSESFRALVESRLESIALGVMEKNPKTTMEELAKILNIGDKTFRKYCRPKPAGSVSALEMREMREKHAGFVGKGKFAPKPAFNRRFLRAF